MDYQGASFLFLVYAEKFLTETDFDNEDDYVDYVMANTSPGLLVRCVSVCGNVQPNAEGRVLDFEEHDYIGFAIKVQWRTGVVRWYPAANLQLGRFRSEQQLTKKTRPVQEDSLEDDIFEPGDRVRIRSSFPPDRSDVWQRVVPAEIGIISGISVALAMVELSLQFANKFGCCRFGF